MEDVAVDLVCAVVEANVQEFGATSPMTAAGLSKCERAFGLALTKVPQARYLASNRAEIVKYRGLELQIAVASPQEHFTLSCIAKLKGVAVELGHLCELFCENVLRPGKTYNFKGTVDAALYNRVAVARRFISQSIKDEG